MTEKKKDHESIADLHSVADVGRRTESLMPIAQEIEKSMKQNLFAEFCQMDPDDTTGLTLCSVYNAVLTDFMSHVYVRINDGVTAQFHLDKLKEQLKDHLH